MKHSLSSIQLNLLSAPVINSFSSLLFPLTKNAVINTHPNNARPTSIHEPTSSSALYLSRNDTSSDVVVDVSPEKKSKTSNKNGQTEEEQQQQRSSSMMKYGMFLSSFPDGVIQQQSSENTPNSSTFFQYSISSILMMEYINQLQKEIESSAKHSPCAGPNIDYLNLLERGDDIFHRLQKLISSSFLHNANNNDNNINKERADGGVNVLSSSSSANSDSSGNTEIGKEVLEYIQKIENTIITSSYPPTIKILYIPTAMYALRADSKNSPGKQRQRARADGKKRRDRIVRSVEKLFQIDDNNDNDDHNSSSLNVLALTLDLDDGSLKQPVAKGYRFDDTNIDVAAFFPKSGQESLTDWNPHLVYVEGGNTFWLQHCIEKGDWSKLIIDACSLSSSKDKHPALYIGSSAGAIIAGKFVETATWKEWDDPSIIPGRETYDDWKGQIGLNLAGGASFFPHMGDEFETLVKDKKEELNESVGSDTIVHALREEGSYFIYDEEIVM